MAKVTQLAYVGLAANDIDAFGAFASSILGMGVTARPDGGLAVRMDERPARLFVDPGPVDGLSCIGWEVAGPAQLQVVFDDLAAGGFDPVWEQERAAERGMADLVSCTDPAGTRLEFGWGPWSIMEPEHVSPVRVRYVTGPLGLGHVVLQRARSAEVGDFYHRHLGFRLTDRLFDENGLVFFGCNARHHSVAVADVGGPDRLLHIMLQVATIDELGGLFDAALDSGVTMSTIGMHPNDRATSFYIETPAGCEIEIGWDPILIDETTWSSTTVDRASAWGHRRVLRADDGSALVGPPRVPPRVPPRQRPEASEKN